MKREVQRMRREAKIESKVSQMRPTVLVCSLQGGRRAAASSTVPVPVPVGARLGLLLLLLLASFPGGRREQIAIVAIALALSFCGQKHTQGYSLTHTCMQCIWNGGLVFICGMASWHVFIAEFQLLTPELWLV